MSASDLNVIDEGEGHPVVLLHGLTATHRYVVHGSRQLERSGHRVVAYDARGHGESAAGEGYSYGALAGDLLRVMDALEIKRAVLAGASMGAHTALRFAIDRPERVAGLVVITPAYHPSVPPDLARWDRLAAGLREDGVDGFVRAYGDPGVQEDWRDTVLTVLRQRLSQHRYPHAVADALEQVPRSRPFDVHDLEAIRVPTVVVGDRDEADPGHPLAVAQSYARRIPGAELVVEDEGRSPIAWQGGQLSRVIAGVVEKAAAAR